MSIELREEARKREAEQESLRKEQEQFVLDVRAVASRPEGARFLARLLERGGIFRADYQPGDLGAYRAGRKAGALELWRTLQECLSREQFIAIAFDRRNELKNEQEPQND